ncbi:unnamed protein product [Amoebophrya sp. A25]|nr:unnamed protein product [Amoebophrya sp. A25]|eukprot:GSA25T00005842001.1
MTGAESAPAKAERLERKPVQKLPLNVVQQLKQDPSKGRYARTDVMDATDRQELLYSVQEENTSLKKTNQKLSDQVKQLGIKFSQIQKEMLREGYQVEKTQGMREAERLHKSLQQDHSAGGASSSSQPWVPSAGVGAMTGPRRGNSRSPSTGARRPVSGSTTGMLRNRSALSPGRNLSPERSGVARMLVEETEQLRKTIAELREKNERLSSQMEGVMSARGSKGVSAVETAFYREQLDDKEVRLKQLVRQLDEERESFHKERKEMTSTVNRLEKEKLAVESDLRHALALGDETENASLHRKVKESDEMNKKLMDKINQLTSNAFISTADTRVASAKRLERLEEELKEKAAALTEALAAKDKLGAETETLRKKSEEADTKFKTVWEESERMRIRLEEKERQAKAVEEQLAILRDSLPPEERAAVEKSLSLALIAGTASGITAATSAAAAAAAGGAVAQPASELSSVDSLTRAVSQLRREKHDLAQEMAALQNILRRESEINAELKTLHQFDLADMQTKADAMLADREKWERLAKSRESKVKELQKQIRTLERVQEEKEDDVISEAGFSDISETVQSSSENALDLVVNSAKMEFKVVSQHFFPNLPIFHAENALMSNVLIDFYEFDTVSSRTASGLEPRYDSIITCSPFAVNEQVIKFFNTGAIRFSLQAFTVQQPGMPPAGGPPVLIGEATLPLVHLLNCTPLDPNPMVSGTLKFVSKKDPNTPIAHLAYKMKLRYSILDLLHNFQHQRNKDELALQMARPEMDPALLDQVRRINMITGGNLTGFPSTYQRNEGMLDQRDYREQNRFFDDLVQKNEGFATADAFLEDLERKEWDSVKRVEQNCVLRHDLTAADSSSYTASPLSIWKGLAGMEGVHSADNVAPASSGSASPLVVSDLELAQNTSARSGGFDVAEARRSSERLQRMREYQAKEVVPSQVERISGTGAGLAGNTGISVGGSYIVAEYPPPSRSASNSRQTNRVTNVVSATHGQVLDLQHPHEDTLHHARSLQDRALPLEGEAVDAATVLKEIEDLLNWKPPDIETGDSALLRRIDAAIGEKSTNSATIQHHDKKYPVDVFGLRKIPLTSYSNLTRDMITRFDSHGPAKYYGDIDHELTLLRERRERNIASKELQLQKGLEGNATSTAGALTSVITRNVNNNNPREELAKDPATFVPNASAMTNAEVLPPHQAFGGYFHMFGESRFSPPSRFLDEEEKQVARQYDPNATPARHDALLQSLRRVEPYGGLRIDPAWQRKPEGVEKDYETEFFDVEEWRRQRRGAKIQELEAERIRLDQQAEAVRREFEAREAAIIQDICDSGSRSARDVPDIGFQTQGSEEAAVERPETPEASRAVEDAVESVGAIVIERAAVPSRGVSDVGATVSLCAAPVAIQPATVVGVSLPVSGTGEQATKMDNGPEMEPVLTASSAAAQARAVAAREEDLRSHEPLVSSNGEPESQVRTPVTVVAASGLEGDSGSARTAVEETSTTAAPEEAVVEVVAPRVLNVTSSPQREDVGGTNGGAGREDREPEATRESVPECQIPAATPESAIEGQESEITDLTLSLSFSQTEWTVLEPIPVVAPPHPEEATPALLAAQERKSLVEAPRVVELDKPVVEITCSTTTLSLSENMKPANVDMTPSTEAVATVRARNAKCGPSIKPVSVLRLPTRSLDASESSPRSPRTPRKPDDTPRIMPDITPNNLKDAKKVEKPATQSTAGLPSSRRAESPRPPPMRVLAPVTAPPRVPPLPLRSCEGLGFRTPREKTSASALDSVRTVEITPRRLQSARAGASGRWTETAKCVQQQPQTANEFFRRRTREQWSEEAAMIASRNSSRNVESRNTSSLVAQKEEGARDAADVGDARRNSATGVTSASRKISMLSGNSKENAYNYDDLPSPRRENARRSNSEMWSEVTRYVDDPEFSRQYFRERVRENWESEAQFQERYSPHLSPRTPRDQPTTRKILAEGEVAGDATPKVEHSEKSALVDSTPTTDALQEDPLISAKQDHPRSAVAGASLTSRSITPGKGTTSSRGQDKTDETRGENAVNSATPKVEKAGDYTTNRGHIEAEASNMTVDARKPTALSLSHVTKAGDSVTDILGSRQAELAESQAQREAVAADVAAFAKNLEDLASEKIYFV